MTPASAFTMFVNLENTAAVTGTNLSSCPADRPGVTVGCAGYVVVDGRPATGADCVEAITEAYRRYGHKLSEHLLGQFCAAIADHEKKQVVLIQDSLGLRTIYYQTLSPARVVLASDLRTMQVAAPNMELDQAYFLYFLSFGARLSGRTPYARIGRLAMGETLVLKAGSKVRCYPWRPSNESGRPTDDNPERVRDLVERAVLSALPREGNVLAELSGGLDSSSVLCAAFPFRPDIQALTFVSGSNRSSDDPLYSEMVVRHLGNVRWHSFDQDPYPPFAMEPALAEVEPGSEIRSALRSAYYGLLRSAKIDVVLTGGGGDQVFGSTDAAPIYIADKLRTLNFAGAWRESARWRHNGNTLRSESFWVWHYGVKAAWRHARGRSLVYTLSRMKAPWLSDFVLRQTKDVSPSQIIHRLTLPSRQHYWEMLMRLAENESTAPNLGASAQFRLPLLYRPLAEYMIRLSAKYRRGELGDRMLQREAVKGLLPEAVRLRRDKGTNQVLREQSFVENPSWTDSLLDNPLIAQFGWVRPSAWAEAVARARFGLVSHPMAFDAAMCVERWLRLNHYTQSELERGRTNSI
jgi:asparagine synthase (glutamine-hydrolysing)